MIVDDGVNDEEACEQAFKKLESEGFFEEVKRKYGFSPVRSEFEITTSRVSGGRFQENFEGLGEP
jgi:hypothetical protein